MQRFLDFISGGLTSPHVVGGGGGTVRPRKCTGCQSSERSSWLSSTRCNTDVLTTLIVNHAANPRSRTSPKLRVGTFGGAEGGGYAT